MSTKFSVEYFNELVGMTFQSVSVIDNNTVRFISDDGYVCRFKYFPQQDPLAPNDLQIRSITGDLKDLLHHPICEVRSTYRYDDDSGGRLVQTFTTMFAKVEIEWDNQYLSNDRVFLVIHQLNIICGDGTSAHRQVKFTYPNELC